MTTISLRLDDRLTVAFQAVCSKRGRTTEAVAGDLIRRYVEAEQLKETMNDLSLQTLYGELEQEDRDLANLGLDDYRSGLAEADAP